ncbi:MAG: hypothetical protein HOC74_28825 [Gemmatimonadetes bacterium]|jgi:hypothetical protein|nr:hypothetical protein [Gemmatimonadota bacterium]
MSTPLSSQEEAGSLLERDEAFARSQSVITHQFDVIQTRTQAVIGLATLALTITGFSGPKIAASSPFSRYAMVLGLCFTLISVCIALVGALHIRWLTQIGGETPEAALTSMIEYRDRKTRRFRQALVALVVGLSFYVASVVTFMLKG